MHLSNDDLAFFDRFHKSPDGQYLLRLLQAKLAERDQALRTSTGEEVYRSQGRALELAELIGDITKAQQKLTRSVRPVTSRTPYAA